MKFLTEYIIARFGVPNQIFMDNGKHFKRKEVSNLYKIVNIKKEISSPYYPQENDLVEDKNKTIVNILCKRIQKHGRYWHELLQNAYGHT